MSKRRKFIDGIINRANNGDPAIKLEMWQKRPYTAARARITFGFGETHKTGLGFSKVSLPDEWDSDEGQIIAVRRAIADIWRQMKK